MCTQHSVPSQEENPEPLEHAQTCSSLTKQVDSGTVRRQQLGVQVFKLTVVCQNLAFNNSKSEMKAMVNHSWPSASMSVMSSHPMSQSLP